MLSLLGKYNHGIVALIIMVLAMYLGIAAYVGIALSFFFIGREHAQAEQRGISRFYGNKRANAPWYVGFELRSWNLDSFLRDLLLPIAICGIGII